MKWAYPEYIHVERMALLRLLNLLKALSLLFIQFIQKKGRGYEKDLSSFMEDYICSDPDGFFS
jgi:hypothetical protein